MDLKSIDLIFLPITLKKLLKLTSICLKINYYKNTIILIFGGGGVKINSFELLAIQFQK